MKKLYKNNIDFYFLISLLIGTILRVFMFLNNYIVPDTYLYFDATIDLLKNDYNSFRPPGFSITILPFLLLIGSGPLSARLTSLSFSIFLIICSYFVFTKASLKLLNRDKNNKLKAKFVGFIVSFLISFNLFFIFNSGKGLREELLAVLIIIIFYFTIIKDKTNLRENIYLAILVCLLALTHLSAGIFVTIGIFLFFAVSKLKFFKYNNISNSKILIIFLATSISFLFWGLYSYYKFGDFLYNLHYQNLWFKKWYNLDLFSSVDDIINALQNAVKFGIPTELLYLISLIGFVLMILFFFMLIVNIKERQMFFIFIVLLINFAYLSIFLGVQGKLMIPKTPGHEPSPRLIIYFFPFIFYLGALPLGISFKESKIINWQSKNYSELLLIIYFLSYPIHGIQFFLINISLLQSFLIGFSIFIFLINELPLLIYIMKNRNKDYYFLKASSNY